MIYTISTRREYEYEDGDVNLMLATDDLEKVEEYVARLATTHDGEEYSIRVSAWDHQGSEAEFIYWCESRTSSKGGFDNFDIETLLETLAYRFAKAAEIKQAERDVKRLMDEYALAVEKLEKLRGKQ